MSSHAVNRRRWLFLAASVLAAGAGALLAWRQRAAPAQPSPLPELLALELPDAQGAIVPLAQYTGRPIVLNFWATWCPPCVDEMPELSEMQQSLAGLDVQILGIGVDSAANIQRFAEKTPMKYPLLIAGPDAIDWMRRLGNARGALPFTVVFDREGQIQARILGRFSRPALTEAIQAAARRP